MLISVLLANDIDFHFIYDQVSHKQFYVSHINIVDQFTDSLTKPLSY